jgi:ribosomal protein S6
MRIYEINYIVSGSTKEDELKALALKISGYISENEGKAEKIAEPLKKFLGFQVASKKDIFFNSIIFSMPQEKLLDFEKKVKTETTILKYNLLKRDTVESNSGQEFYRRRRKPMEPAEILTEKNETSKPKKADLKEIDQKIEEILSE